MNEPTKKKKERFFDTSEIVNQKPESIKVVIGMSGKVDSAVAAFLLKKQGFQVIGVGISLWEEKHLQPPWQKFGEACSVNDMEAAKIVCDQIGIPFYGVNAQPEYYENVLDPMIARTISGEQPTPCLSCHQLKVKILYDKMLKLNADFFATGHFAKIYKNHQTNEFFVYSANEIANDQSKFLAGLNQKMLRKLMFPLSELLKKDVKALGKNFKIPILEETKTNQMCYVRWEGFSEFIEDRSSEKFTEVGQIINYTTENYFGENHGIHAYYLGQVDVSTEKTSPLLDKKAIVLDRDYETKNIYIGNPDDIVYSVAHIENVRFTGKISIVRPLKMFAKLATSERVIPVKVTFKNNSTAFILFDEPINLICEGEELIFYNKAGPGGKVFLSGTICYLGDFRLLDRTFEFRGVDPDDPEEMARTIKELFY
jgi:tRNA-specific 2-thiouridylase